ncbi:unnamed protein product [Prorocentrum cordatum]|uniref:PA14 domain-containing protein n=1 Tax=Prorocentrum cordatum TaxID=2364126 RepID=A0ABN9UNM5_9DINO|nr:unnamed protein product [Polarella glacialis]
MAYPLIFATACALASMVGAEVHFMQVSLRGSDGTEVPEGVHRDIHHHNASGTTPNAALLVPGNLLMAFSPADVGGCTTLAATMTPVSLTAGSDTRDTQVLGSNACDAGGTGGTRDTGFRTTSANDKVVSSEYSWTVGGWIYKSGAPGNWWHIFTDGQSGDMLTITSDGTIRSSMNSAPTGVFNEGGDIVYGFSYNALIDGWHEITLRYSQPEGAVQLFVDGVPEDGSGHLKTINTAYRLRNFWGWGSASDNP